MPLIMTCRKRTRASTIASTTASASLAASLASSRMASSSRSLVSTPAPTNDDMVASEINLQLLCSQRKRVRTAAPLVTTEPEPSTISNVPENSSAAAVVKPDPLRFDTKAISLGTMYCSSSSYVTVNPGGLMLHIETEFKEKVDILLPFTAFAEYTVCEAASLPVMIIRSSAPFGESVRTAIPSLKRTDSQDLSHCIFDPFSTERGHWYVILELVTASALCDLLSKLMQSNISSSATAAGRFMVPKPIDAEEAKQKMIASRTVTLKWKALKIGSWRSKQCSDTTVHMSSKRIKFKARNESEDIIFAIHLDDKCTLSLCVAQSNPVLFVKASDMFIRSTQQRLDLPSSFQQGRDYYHPYCPDIRFKYVTFRLEKQGLSRDTCQQIIEMAGDRLYNVEQLSSRNAGDILHKLTYQPISTKSVRVGANELDETRAVTIHYDSLCICGCMLDSVVTMNICISDIKEISLCMHERLPVLFVKTSTSISQTLKKNMFNRSMDVYFDPISKDIRTQYIVIEMAETTSKETLKAILSTLVCILTNFNDRANVPKEERANSVKLLSKKKAETLLASIKQPLPAKECMCRKNVDHKFKEEVTQYVQTMTQKHGCGAMEKIASRAVDLQKKILCSVCLDKDCQIVFSCGHMICERCDRALKKCHLCRMKILRRIRIFI